jgi:hypothetical protein
MKTENGKRMTLYLGTGEEGDALLEKMQEQAATDLRFRGSPMNFARYAIRYTLENDRSLKRSKRG